MIHDPQDHTPRGRGLPSPTNGLGCPGEDKETVNSTSKWYKSGSYLEIFCVRLAYSLSGILFIVVTIYDVFETTSLLQQSPHLEKKNKLQSFAIFTSAEFGNLVDYRLILGSPIKRSLVFAVTTHQTIG